MIEENLTNPLNTVEVYTLQEDEALAAFET